MRNFFLFCLVLFFSTQQIGASAAEQRIFRFGHSLGRSEIFLPPESESSQSASDRKLAGTYRPVLIDGRSYNPDSIFDSASFFGSFKTFTIMRVKGDWFFSDEAKSVGWLMREYDAEDRLDERFAERLGNKTLVNAPCLDSGGASRMRICAITPGATLTRRNEEYTISTGYFAFDEDHIILLEKIR